ncbi:laccase [Coniella lustricola]|uniref:laccase n=1 Tax=Coniella lustricola TaxID=2025994 RepID=A0A2T3ANL0_9PEZI|nr:laccase [Coniella lustricola]
MPSFIGALFSGLIVSQLSWAAPSLLHSLDARQQQNCNTASNRACWIQGQYDINTDYEIDTPLTGVIREYELTLTQAENWVGPDGVVKDSVMLVNGDIIGPLIYAQWGDTISVKVTNNLEFNGTSIHWHGIRQLNTNLQDGVNGATECPIPPNGGTRTYTYIAHQYGTSWYHSHFSAQYGNGVIGPIQIDGPASLPYDIDLGPLILSDYYYQTADYLVVYTQSNAPPASDNVLFNGTNINPANPSEGEYKTITLTPGKRHRLRLINTSVENHFQVSIVGHDMTVIGTDFVPVDSFTTSSLFVGIGQRYDVTIDASQATDNYWMNVTFGGGGGCGKSNNPYPAAIIHYDGAATGNPTNLGTVPTDHECLDLINFTPVVSRSVPTSSFTATGDNTLDIESVARKWTIDGSSLVVDWGHPLAQYAIENSTAWPSSDNVYQIDAENQWVYWLIQNDPAETGPALPHPIHLHGHDFVVLGRSPDEAPQATTYYNFTSSDVFSLNGNNPLRRDVTMLPAKGWLLLAFKTDNPGAWLMHCHIAWHASGGLGLSFLENMAGFSEGVSQSDVDVLNSQCDAWNAYYPSNDAFLQDDSGV